MKNKLLSFIRKDSMLLGIIIGIVVPGIFYGIFELIFSNFINNETGKRYLERPIIMILAIAINALLLRYFLINRKADLTGRGILLVTFIFAIIFFVLKLNIIS